MSNLESKMKCEKCKDPVDETEIYGDFYYCSKCDQTFDVPARSRHAIDSIIPTYRIPYGHSLSIKSDGFKDLWSQ